MIPELPHIPSGSSQGACQLTVTQLKAHIVLLPKNRSVAKLKNCETFSFKPLPSYRWRNKPWRGSNICLSGRMAG